MDTALYIQINGRGWIVWETPHNELMAVPEDEQPYSDKDLTGVQQYLYNEGFFSEHFQQQLL
jgi:hypothetical protein